jgi:hypothetical protein
MKPTVFVAAIVTALFAFGCQEDDSLGPLAGPASQATSLTKPAPGTGLYLPFSAVMLDPANGAVEITGGMEVLISGQNPFEVTLITKAELTPFERDPVPWYIDEKSTDRIKLEPGKTYFLMKSYKIPGRPDGAKLRVAVAFDRDAIDRADAQPQVRLAKLYLDVPLHDFPGTSSTE